jgi:hypothetical protein
LAAGSERSSYASCRVGRRMRWSDEMGRGVGALIAQFAVGRAICCRSTSLAVAFLPLISERRALIRQLSASKCCRSANHQPAACSNRCVLAARFRFSVNYKNIWLVCRFVGNRRARVTFFCCPIWEHRNRFVLRLGNRTRGCRSESETDRMQEPPVFWIRGGFLLFGLQPHSRLGHFVGGTE